MIVCTQCGFQNESEDAFCGSCGAFLEWAGDRPDTAEAAAGRAAGSEEKPTGVITSTVAPPRTDAGDPPPVIEVDEDDTIETEGEAEVPHHGAEDEASQRAAALLAKPPAPGGTTGSAGPPSPPPPAGDAPAARRPEAVQPAPPTRRPVPPKPPTTREVRPGDLVCGECGGGNDPGRRFCRSCGATLVAVEEAPAPPPLPWWKKPFVRRRQPKLAAAGERPMRRGGTRTTPRTMRQRLWQARRAIVLLAVLGVGIGFAGPWRGRVEDTVGDLKKRVFPGFDQVHAIRAGADSEAPDHPADHSIDDNTLTYWAEGVDGEGTGQKIWLAFDDPVDLGKIGFTLGAESKADEFRTRSRPEKIRLRFLGGADHEKELASQELTLKDTRDFQDHDVDGSDGTTRLSIEILTTRPARSGGTTDTSIAEIEFWERK